jgi:diguanylate cyclase (GGDEF)-like protein/PAS domain S-box-containing protein
LVPHLALAVERCSTEADRSLALLRDVISSHDRFPTLFDANAAGMVLFDRTGNLVKANRSALAFLGVELTDIAERRYGAFLDRAWRDRAREAFARAAAGENVETTTRVTVASGEIVEVGITLTPSIVEGIVAGVYGTARLADQTDDAARRIQDFASLFGHNADAVLALDCEGRVVDANRACRRITGYSTRDLRGRTYLSLIAPDASLAARAAFQRVLRGESFATDTALIRRNGRRIELTVTSVPIVVEGRVAGAYFIGNDVTEKRRLAAAAREQSERIRELYLVSAASPSGDVETQIAAALELGCRRLRCEGASVARVDRDKIRYLFTAGQTGRETGDAEPLHASLHRLVFEAGVPLIVNKNDPRGVLALIGAPVPAHGDSAGMSLLFTSRRGAAFGDADRDFAGLIAGLVGTVIERWEQRKRAELLAFYDPLTGLPNRTLLADRLAQTIASAERHESQFAVHFYDLDGFKAVNDDHGHLRGDEVLRIVARRLKNAARAEDTVARLGGDEFVVLQPDVQSRAAVVALSARFSAALGEPLVVGGTTYRMSASVGVALYPADGRDGRTLLALADEALYRVKERGGNAIEFVSPSS